MRVKTIRRVLVAGVAASALLLTGMVSLSATAAEPEGCHPTKENRPVCQAGSPAETATFLDATAEVEEPEHVSLAEHVYVGPFAELVADDDAPISIGDESNVQDNVQILGARDDDSDDDGGRRAARGEGHAEPGVEIGDRVILAHGVSVIGPAQIGVEGSDIPADPAGVQEVFLSFSSQVDGAVLERNTGVGALGRVGPGVRLRSGFIVLPGKNVTTQAEADDPALGKVRLINEADVAFNEAVIEVNIALAREYTRLYRDKASNVRGVNFDPGHTEFNHDRNLPSFAGQEKRVPGFRNRLIGDLNLLDTFSRFSSVSGARISIRADEGEPFGVGLVDQMGDDVIFHALEGTELVTGDRVVYGDKVVVHGGGRVIIAGDPEEPTVVGDDVVLEDESIVFRSTIGEGSVIGQRSVVVGSELAPGTEVPPRTIIINGVKFGDVEW
jgi:carbonic anhydrase/acetyltransferase-like protein (isoleucine patch superfamily)